MFKDLNRVEIMGRVTQDPEVKYTKNNTAYVILNIATNRSIKRGDEWENQVTFHAVTFWAKKAEGLGEKARKGTKIWVEGSLAVNKYETNDGKKVTKLFVLGNEFSLLADYKTKDKQEVQNAPVKEQIPADQAIDQIFSGLVEDGEPQQNKPQEKLEDGGAF